MDDEDTGPPLDCGVPPAHDGRLVIRAIRSDDVDGVIALYDDLDADDRYRRFFGHHRPRREFFEQLATVAERGGVGLVAVDAEGGAGRVIGEAGCVLLPNGDGELAITIAHHWRGWLGPYLLDALTEAAAASGIPNLEAEVLAVNGPMLALLRARGSVVMEHADWNVLRLLISTSGPTPSWPGAHDRPRVLVEGSAGRWPAEAEARAAGLEVLTCPGPSSAGRHCPAIVGEPCPLAAGADAIVVSRRPEDETWQQLVDAHPTLHAGVPVWVETNDRPPPGATPRCAMDRQSAVVTIVDRLARRSWSPDADGPS